MASPSPATTTTASPSSAGGRSCGGRRKQAKPQRKQVEVDHTEAPDSRLHHRLHDHQREHLLQQQQQQEDKHHQQQSQYDAPEDAPLTVETAAVASPHSRKQHHHHLHHQLQPVPSSPSVASSASSSMSPSEELLQQRLLNGGAHKQATVPEEVLADDGGALERLLVRRLVKTGGTAEDATNDSVSAKAAVGEQQSEDDDDKIREYLQRSDTAVIYAEPVVTVPPFLNGLKKEVEEINSQPEYFIKCPQCQKGYQTFQALKEHIEQQHQVDSSSAPPPSGGASSVESGVAALAPASACSPSAVSPTPSCPSSAAAGAVGAGGFGCAQCPTSFSNKDQLEKHELLHSPNAQVSCKICNKTFANVYRLQRHMISHDESAVLRKFKCTECEKAFKFKHHLKEHVRIHSGEKPFVCGNCGKRFSHSGSYSSHMSSKKCLVINLKVGRGRGSPANSLMDKSPQGGAASGRVPKRANPLNNNLSTSPNHNAYLPILPKYTEAAAAFLHSSLASSHPMHHFYMNPANILQSTAASTLGPYSIPSLNHILEQLQNASSSSPHHRFKEEQGGSSPSYSQQHEDMLTEEHHHQQQPPLPLSPSADKSDSSNSLVISIAPDNDNNNTTAVTNTSSTLPNNTVVKVENRDSNGNDLEAVKRILETVNASVTKQLFQDSVSAQKYCSSEEQHQLEQDKQHHQHHHHQQRHHQQNQLSEDDLKSEEHKPDVTKIKHEGLAAKLEEIAHFKTEQADNYSCGEEDVDSDRMHDKSGDDYELDCESVTTTDQVSEDGRKVRVRSLIADKQLKVLKDHYAVNARPKREELVQIAEKIGFPVRVVQVWFQNTRARDRREGRLANVTYGPIQSLQRLSLSSSTTTNMHVPSGLSHHRAASASSSSFGNYPLAPSPPVHNYTGSGLLEQPLDLSLKKSPHSSPAVSPHHSPLSNVHSDSGEEAVNLILKSSRSPTPFQQAYHNNYSNSSSDHHRSPSPIDYAGTSSSKLAKILAQQSSHPLNMSMDGFMRLQPALSHLMSSRLSNLSPTGTGSDKRPSWSDDGLDFVGALSQHHDGSLHENGGGNKRLKNSSHLVIKGLNSPSLSGGGNVDGEAEGQFICDQCDKAFSKQSSLARHKYEHSGQRPHKCDECPKAFKHKHHLTEHKRLHSGEKPFQCIKCLKRFSHSGSYSQHMNHRSSYCKPYRE